MSSGREKRSHGEPAGDTPGKPDAKTSKGKSTSTSRSSRKSLFDITPPVSDVICK